MNAIFDDLNRQGYHVAPEFLSDKSCNIMRKLLSGLPATQIVENKGGDFHGNRTVLAPNIITHSEVFLDLATDRRILDVADKFFEPGTFKDEKDPYQLHLMHARMVAEEADAQELHIDSRLCGVNPPLILHIFFYLDDCLDEGSGATRVVPGSHRYMRYSELSDNADAIPVFGKKGTAIFINSNTYHGSSAKTSAGERWLITLAFSRWWIRQPFAIPYFSKWPRQLTAGEKNLLGFNNYAEKSLSVRGLRARGELPRLVPGEA